MSSDNRVSVDPDRAVRCSWCGSYESDKWHHEILMRSRVWCSQSCYRAGQFETLVFSTSTMVIIDLFLILWELSLPAPPTPLGVVLFTFLFILTGLFALASVLSYSIRGKIPRVE